MSIDMTLLTARDPVRGANRLDARAKAARPLLACYFPLGDPVFDDGLRDIYAEEGVDIVELGLPARDPYLDGADIADAMARALAGPVDPYDRLAEMVGWAAADAGRPAGVCMAYDMDLARLSPATLAGLDGLLLIGRHERADAAAIDGAMHAHDVRDCGLVPLGFDARGAAAARALDGYVMMQAVAGVTGPRASLDDGLGAAIAGLRAAGVTRPILAGFGIGTAAQARNAVDLGADGVVIGSMCMRKALEGPAAIRGFLRSVRAALDA
jgi:tryptophan synthase alpha chain